jgi:phenylalanyl-tRNA synthetase beta chain
MVSVNISRKGLLEMAGAPELSDVELEDALMQIKCSLEAHDKATGELSIEVNGDRPDLLSRAGIARALAGFLDIASGSPAFNPAKPTAKLIAEESALKVRPFICGAIVEGVTLDDTLVAELFNQQEKIVMGLGRKRKKVSVGSCDTSKLTFPIRFTTLDPQTKYIPLGFDVPMTLQQVVDKHPKGKEHGHILKGFKQYPCLQDAKGLITTLVPISNSAETSVTVNTKSLFVDAEGIDEQATNTALSIMCQDFADYGWRVHQLQVQYPTKNMVTPTTQKREETVVSAQANKLLGLNLSPEQIVHALGRQRIDSFEKGATIHASIPAYRGDFIHPVDLVEEIEIGYGVNNFQPLAPTFYTKGEISHATLEENYLRDFFIGAGFLELSTHVLTNEARVRKARSIEELVEISNPVSSDYHALRGSLLPNLIQVLSENTHTAYPQRIFEVGEVVVPNESLPERMATIRRVGAITAHASASLTEVASLALELAKRKGHKMQLKPLHSAGQYINGRACTVEFDGVQVGSLGEIHPQVLIDFGIAMPAAALEIKA